MSEGTANKVRLLALHGSGSHRDVTRFQLDNLGLTESEYEVVYANGPFTVNFPGSGLAEMQGVVSGPWFSWFSPDYNSEGSSLQDDICQAVKHILELITRQGPFDGVFGFSQGAVIADLVCNLPRDPALLSALEQRFGSSILPELTQTPLFPTAVFACAAAPLPLDKLREKAELGPQPESPRSCQSIHLIGKHDDYKAWSESFAKSSQLLADKVFYLPCGHEINRHQRADKAVTQALHQCFRKGGSDAAQLKALHWLKSSPLSARAMAEDAQLATVKVATGKLPNTIIEMLSAQSDGTPFLRLARETNDKVVTTYGQMLAFCQPEGGGDLRQLGVQAGEVVAYLAPGGGSAVAATAFLSIASQTCAVPLSASMSELEALQALEQFSVKHMILFPGVNASGVLAAFQQYASTGQASVHYAGETDMPSPGLFRYSSPIAGFKNLPVLVNPVAGNSLLLRTSGTTSVPKIVPLRQQDLVHNAVILADGIGLNACDVTYSIMPLDHIGGISGSILCSMAVGATITCDDLYNPQAMVEALQYSNPQPTWYSAVPTIHNATIRYLHDHSDTHINPNGQWQNHNLRMVRSGAAALKEQDRANIEATYGVEVLTTYSMSEQMPISQPPRREGKWLQESGAVGVPVTCSMAIVDPLTFRPLPYGMEGEVAISGSPMFKGYQNNAKANQASHFLMKSRDDGELHNWFVTGDIGEMAADGTLTLRGRLKELIKRGGEQVSPAEVENIITGHPGIQAAVCFSVPSETYGEEVGCALILEPSTADDYSEQNLIRELRQTLRNQGLAAYKVPSAWRVVTDDELPRTASKKIIRNGLAGVLGVTATQPVGTSATFAPKSPPENSSAFSPGTVKEVEAGKPVLDWSALAGFRFLLACYVMFMHIGSDQSWDGFANLRQFPWHVHAFFTLAGFTLAAVMPALIKNKFRFVFARISNMYPLYGLAILLALGNLLVSCQPSTFSPLFSWWGEFAGSGQQFCQGTPLVQGSWLANLLLTLGIYATGLQATPLWGASWFLGFYLWFISMYFQCLIVFPYMYNALYKHRGDTRRLLLLTVLGLVVNVLIVLLFWYGYALDATGYGSFDPLTGERTIPDASQIDAAGQDNAVILGFYLFAPFWMVYFIAGMCAAFLYDAVRPAERNSAFIWGYVADAITMLMIVVSIAHVAQGYVPHGPSVTAVSLEPFFMRPDAADTFADPATVNRIWDNIYGRLFAPITLLWMFAISTGQGWTARVLRFNPISQVLAPTAYACFLFHQMVGQWYYSITRNGEWWSWWTHQKSFYWFSPQPVPVEWYEYFYVVGLVVLFAKAVQPVDALIKRGFTVVLDQVKGDGNKSAAELDTLSVVMNIVQRSTGMEVKPEWSLEDCGLASLGIVQFTQTLEAEFSTRDGKISLSTTDVMQAVSVHEIATLVDDAQELLKLHPSVVGGGLQSS